MTRGNIAILLAIVAFSPPPITAADLPVIIDPLPKGAIASLGSTRFRYPFLPKRMLVSPDGQRLAVLGHVGIWVFDVATGEVIWREHYNGIYDGYCDAYEFSGPDAIVKCQIHLGGSCSLTHFHIPTNRTEWKIELPTTYPHPAFSTDGTLFLTVDLKTLFVNSTKSGKVLVRIQAPDLKNVNSIHFSPNNRTVVAVTDKGLLLFYDRVLGGETGRTQCWSAPKQLQFSADGASVVAIWDSMLICNDSLTGTLKHICILKEPLKVFALTPNLELFTLRSDQTGIDILNVKTNQYRPAISLADTRLLQLTMSHDGKTLFALSDIGAILVYDIASGKRLPQSALTEDQSNQNYFYSLSFPHHSPDRIIEITRSWTVWDTSTGQQAIIPQPQNPPRIALSRDGTKTLAVDNDSIQICNAASRAKIQQLSLRGLPELKNVAFSNDGTAVVGHSESTIVSINLSTGKVDDKRLPKPFEYPMFSDDGKRIAVYQRQTIGDVVKSKLTIHDMNNKLSVWEIDQPISGESMHFAFTRNDTMFLVHRYVPDPDMTSPKQFIDCYDFPSRKLRRTLCDLNAYAASPDGRLVLSALPIHHLSIIEVASGKARMSFPYPKFDNLSDAQFSPDSRRLATKMCSNVLYVWDLNPSDALLTEPDRDGLENAWTELGAIDAAIGFEAIRRLSKYPAKSLPFLAAKLSPANAWNLDHVAVWLTQLDAPDYDSRRTAYRKLAAVSQRIEPRLKSIRDSTSSLEIREKLQQLLDDQYLPNADNVRIARCGSHGTDRPRSENGDCVSIAGESRNRPLGIGRSG